MTKLKEIKNVQSWIAQHPVSIQDRTVYEFIQISRTKKLVRELMTHGKFSWTNEKIGTNNIRQWHQLNPPANMPICICDVWRSLFVWSIPDQSANPVRLQVASAQCSLPTTSSNLQSTTAWLYVRRSSSQLSDTQSSRRRHHCYFYHNRMSRFVKSKFHRQRTRSYNKKGHKPQPTQRSM